MLLDYKSKKFQTRIALRLAGLFFFNVKKLKPFAENTTNVIYFSFLHLSPQETNQELEVAGSTSGNLLKK